MTRQKAIDLIVKELKLAEIKHPGWPKDKIHQAGIITEEVGEAMQAAIDIEFNLYSEETKQKLIEKFKTEVAQAGAKTLRTLMNLENL